MRNSDSFQGFSPQTFQFFQDLKANNQKTWFDANRKTYDEHVMGPARRFVESLGSRLALVAPAIQADPRVNRSIFRIARDTRFSADKTPYKTHLALWLWEGGERMDSPGFYFQLTSDQIFAGTGLYRFSRERLKAYRQAVTGQVSGPALAAAVEEVRDAGYDLGGQHYKRIPAGFEPTHPNASLLLHNGIYASYQGEIPGEACSSALLDWTFQHYLSTLPLHRWLRENL